jgi:hypothetical protein
MVPRRRVVPILALALLPGGASSTPAEVPPGVTQVVPIVEPGKPMRFQAIPAPTAAVEAAPEPCELDVPQDRRTPTSSQCMRCHDGSKATNATTGHRFDVEYQNYGKDLRPEPEKFNPKIVLAGGKVTCLSCHEPLSTLRFHLAAPTEGEVEKRLCVACHIR